MTGAKVSIFHVAPRVSCIVRKQGVWNGCWLIIVVAGFLFPATAFLFLVAECVDERLGPA